MTEYKKIEIEDLQQLVAIFRHENLRYPDGTYPEELWMECFIKEGYAYGLYLNEGLRAAVVAEPLLAGGVNIWLLAVEPGHEGKGFGQRLYGEFEKTMKSMGKEWMFLTSWAKSSSFYLRNGYDTSGLDVREYSKGLE